MIHRVSKTLRFLRTTAIGGVLLLLPVFVVVGLLAYVYHFVVVVHEQLRPYIPFDSAIAFVLIFIVAIVAIFTACFFAGLMARRAIGVHFAGTVEKQLMRFFPKYGIYKDMLAGTVGGHDNAPSLLPVLVDRDGVRYLAFQADRLDDGWVVVYFPGAPDTWNGSLALVAQEKVQPLDLPFGDALHICERLGRTSAAELSAASAGKNFPR